MNQKNILLFFTTLLGGCLAGFFVAWFTIPLWVSTHAFEATMKKLTLNSQAGQIVLDTNGAQPQLSISDANKKVRLKLGLDKDYYPGITMIDSSGTDRVTLKQLENSSLLELTSPDQESISLEAANGYSHIDIGGEGGKARATVFHNIAASEDQITFQLNDMDGKSKIAVQAIDNNVYLSVFDTAGKEHKTMIK